jgi:hypothetical protein
MLSMGKDTASGDSVCQRALVQLRAAEKPNTRRARFRALGLRFAPALDSRRHEANAALLSKACIFLPELTPGC